MVLDDHLRLRGLFPVRWTFYSHPRGLFTLICHPCSYWKEIPHPFLGPPRVRIWLVVRGLTGYASLPNRLFVLLMPLHSFFALLGCIYCFLPK